MKELIAMSKTKKQSKADKAFIAKIATIGISTGAKSDGHTCQNCGKEMPKIGMLVGMMNGEPVAGPVYGHPRRGTRPAESADEQSFAA